MIFYLTFLAKRESENARVWIWDGENFFSLLLCIQITWLAWRKSHDSRLRCNYIGVKERFSNADYIYLTCPLTRSLTQSWVDHEVRKYGRTWVSAFCPNQSFPPTYYFIIRIAFESLHSHSLAKCRRHRTPLNWAALSYNEEDRQIWWIAL